MLLGGGYDEKSWEMACNWLMMTSSGDNNGRVRAWVCSPTKLKIPKAEQETPSLQLRGLKIDKPKAKHDRARLRLRGNKPKAKQETAQPTAARFKKKNINRRQNKKPPRLRLRGLKNAQESRVCLPYLQSMV